jgi:hypothetical protein
MSGVLDAVLPAFRHREVHATVIDREPEVVWAALHAVGGRELAFSRLLMTLRGLRTGGTDKPFLERFVDAGFMVVVDDEPRVLVAAAAGRPWRWRGGDRVPFDGRPPAAFDRPGLVIMATSFELEPVGDGRTRLTTETRVQPTDAAAARAFRRYWWAIRGGSGLIRRDLLRAVRRRAEAAPAGVRAP